MALGLTASLMAGTPSFTHEFAQVGDGGGIRSVFLVLNQNAGEVTVIALQQTGLVLGTLPFIESF